MSNNALSATSRSTTEYARDARCSVDETEVISLLLTERVGREHLMLDVGAHFGTSAAFFDKLGWTIHCFEPDPSNREKLVARLGKSPNVTIDTRAVSDMPATGVSFFKSDESTGISGLHAFRDTHREDGKVDITTVAEVVDARGIEHVDFLKIDVEGFDFSVLKGVPWDRIKPDVIECEFEDYKTVPLGHTYKEVAQYLVDQGYAVYLSEWHPIVRYGIRHDFRRVIPFPGIELQGDAWGNILAFRQDPGLAALNEAFEKAMTRRPSQPATASPAVAAPNTSAANTPAPAATKAGEGTAVSQPASATIARPPSVAPPAYATPAPAAAARPGFRQRTAERVRARSLPAFYLALFALWCLRKIGQRPFFSILALALPVATAALAYFYPQQEIRLPAVAATSGLLVLYASAALVGYLATRVRRVVVKLREEFAGTAARQEQERQALRSQLDASTRRLLAAETGLKQAERTATNRFDGLARTVDANLAAVNARFTTLDHFATSFTDRVSQLEPAMVRRDADVATLVEDVSALRSEFASQATALDSRVDALIDDLSALRGELGAQGTTIEARIDAAVEKAVSDTAQLVSSVRDQLQADIAAIDGKAKEQLGAVNAATGQLKTDIERVERTFMPSPTYNPGLYQHFGRRLPEATAREMAETWSKLLGIGLSRQRLGYLANRSCVLESSMKGRLATAIETVVLRSLVAAAPKRPDVSILEIGTLFGVGAAAVYEAARNDHDEVHLTVLDPLDGYYGTGQRDLLTGAEISEATLRENFAKAPVPEQDYTVIKRLSTEDEAFEEASKRAYDVLIIDGDHSYEGVKYDFDRYGPLVREGGYILFDDYDVADWPDIKRYVDEEILPRTDVELVGAGHRTAVYRVKTAIEPLTDAQAKADMRGNAESN